MFTSRKQSNSFIFMLIFLFASPSFAEDFYPKESGDFDNMNTWEQNKVPSVIDSIISKGRYPRRTLVRVTKDATVRDIDVNTYGFVSYANDRRTLFVKTDAAGQGGSASFGPYADGSPSLININLEVQQKLKGGMALEGTTKTRSSIFLFDNGYSDNLNTTHESGSYINESGANMKVNASLLSVLGNDKTVKLTNRVTGKITLQGNTKPRLIVANEGDMGICDNITIYSVENTGKSLSGNFTTVDNTQTTLKGKISPGCSIGTMSFAGDVSFQDSYTEFEISNILYDQIKSAQFIKYEGSNTTFRIVPVEGFNPPMPITYQLLQSIGFLGSPDSLAVVLYGAEECRRGNFDFYPSTNYFIKLGCNHEEFIFSPATGELKYIPVPVPPAFLLPVIA